MRKYAIITNNTVTSIKDLEDDQVEEIARNSQMIIDIQDMNPQPTLNWILNGNTLQVPCGLSSREEYEIILAERKTDFGIKLARLAVDRIGARNKVLSKTGTQVATLLNQLLGVKLLLETGALGTARYSCVQLKSPFAEYSDIFDYIINEINIFERTFGL